LLALDAKGGESRFRGSFERGFHFSCVLLSCYFHASCLFSRLASCDMCACEILESFVDYLVTIIYHVTCLVIAHKVVLPCLTPISYELCFVY
jgi:hypothetical protein